MRGEPKKLHSEKARILPSKVLLGCQVHLHTDGTSTHASLACPGASDGWC